MSSPAPDFAAVLFDLDGTLVDSEAENAEALARVLARDLGLTMTGAERDFVVGHSWNEIVDVLRADHGPALALSRDELIARAAAEREHVIAERGLTILPGAVEAVRRLGERLPLAICTGSARVEVDQALRVLGLQGAFSALVPVEAYAHGKPAPDCYLLGAERLGVPIGRCLVLEDSAAGISSGRTAGATVVAIRAGNHLGQDQSAAHRIVDTLDDVTWELVATLAAGRQA